MYYPNLKTTDAELRAIRHLDEKVKNRITPIFELTRSRKTSTLINGSLSRRAEQLNEIYDGHQAIIDLCTEPQLMNDETVDLFDEADGYSRWRNFLTENFSTSSYIPCLLYVDEGSEDNFRKQVQWIVKKYKKVCLRLSVTDELFPRLYNWCLEEVEEKNIIISAVLYYIEPSELNRVLGDCRHFINSVIGNRPPSSLLFSGSSFPRLVTKLPGCGDQNGSFPLSELILEETLIRTFSNLKIEASDFASVHPHRYETKGGGWVPRIDYREAQDFKYTRVRRDDGGYRAAANLIPQTSINNLPKSWGGEQIKLARAGAVTGASPSFWISVRINNWITERSGVR